MDIRNPFTLLRDITKKNPVITSDVLDKGVLSQKEKELIRSVGITFSQLQQDLQEDVNVTWDRQRYTTQLNRSLDHALIAAAVRLYSTAACLTGSTKIPLLSGETKTIQEIVQNFNSGKEMWVYSCTSEGVPLPAKLLNAVKQSHKPKTFRIWLDNGKYVEASDNHRFIKRNGSLCRADELNVGDSLMPFHRNSSAKKWKGYEQVWDVKKKKWVSTYKVVASHSSDIDLKEHNKGKNLFKDKKDFLVVHHVDFDKKNNSPKNLKIMTSEEHHKLHIDSLKERWQDPEWHDMMSQKSKESHNTEEYIQKCTGNNHPNWIPLEERVCSRAECNNKYKVKPSSKRKYCSHKCSTLDNRKIKVFITRTCECGDCNEQFKTQIWPDVSNTNQKFFPHHNKRVNREIRHCLLCGEKFECKSNSTKRYCSSSCSNYDRAVPKEIRVCDNENCSNTFEVRVKDTKHFCSSKCANTCEETNRVRGDRISITKRSLIPSNNHKITKIEYIGEKVVYDIEVEGSHLFGLDCGIYIHNTTMSPIHNASVWITSKSSKYQKLLSDLLDDIGIEEKIYDWAWTVAAFGDLFVEINGLPNLGIVSINDDKNPIEISRIEHNGILVGFYNTPMGHTDTSEQKIIEPWKYVHLRLLGAKRNRPAWGDPSYAEYKTMSLMLGHNTRQATSRYGASLLLDALPTYRRLRMAEDSVLLARMTRGILRYMYLLSVNSTNSEMLGELIDQIANQLKRARAINTSDANPNFQSKENPFGVTEDLFLPLPDNTDLRIEEIGGSPDIRWIVDVEELKQQLACALSTPLSLLGGYVDEATGALGSEAIEKLDIGFARNARRLQRALKMGIKRMCQIHLAYQNLDPDPAMFEVNMASPSTAEEKSLQDTLDTGTDVIDKFMTMMETIDPEMDKKEIFNYLNQKILKFEDFDLDQFRTKTVEHLGEKKEKEEKEYTRYPIYDTDLLSYLPLHPIKLEEGKVKNPDINERSIRLFQNRWEGNWIKEYKDAVVFEEESNDEKKHERQMSLAEEESKRKQQSEEAELYNPI